MNEILISATAIAIVVTGLVQVFKQATNINKRFLPLCAVVIGVLVGGAAYFLDAELGLRLWAGGIAGLMSVGLFETGKGIKKEIDSNG